MVKSDVAKPVVSGAVKRFLLNRLSEAFGLVTMAGACALIIALVSASSSDPSLNVATDNEVKNLLGARGAITADILFNFFGIMAFLLPLALASWSYRFLIHIGLRHWYWRMPLLPLAMAVLSAVTVPIDAYFARDMTGVLGAQINSGASAFMAFLNLPDLLPDLSSQILSAQLVVSVILALIGLSLYVWTAGLTRREWGVAKWLLRLIFWPLTALLSVVFRRKAHGQEAANGAVNGAGNASGQAPEMADDIDDVGALRATTKAQKAAEEKAQKQAQKDAQKEAKKLAKEQAALEKKQAKEKAKLAKGARKEPVLVPGAEVASAEVVSAEVPAVKSAKKAAKGAAGNARQTKFDFESQSGFQLPNHNLLKPPSKASDGPGDKVLQENARMLEGVLGDFGVNGEIKDVAYGPVVTRYGLNPAAGTKSQRVIALADDIARSMSALSVRVAVVPGQNVIGIEMPNELRETVLLRDILDHGAWFDNKDSLPICLGKDIAGAPVVTDLAKMPHLLVAGTTGSGKSVGINAMILSLLYRHTPETCRLIMIDPKMLELSVYDGIPHLLSPVVTDPSKAVTSLKWAVREMENRYFNMAKLGVRNITGYNQRLAEARKSGEVLTRRVQTGFDAETGLPTHEEQALDLAPLPFIVVIIDEVADLMLVAGKDIEAAVQRLAQMARAAGIHVIMATQRPSVDVITGTIKANFPTRISFQVTSKIDSRTILGEQGAEQLLGRGDMLYMEGGGRIKRVHGPFMEDQEVEKVANFLRAQGEPEYDDRVTAEPEEGAGAEGGDVPAATGESLYDQAVALVVREQRASTSFVQRHLKIGYNRAATIIEEMEGAGIISKANHAGKREVLIQND